MVWKVLREGESENRGHGSRSLAYHAAQTPTRLEGNSEIEGPTAQFPAVWGEGPDVNPFVLCPPPLERNP